MAKSGKSNKSNPNILIQNKTKQQIGIQVKPPNGDFYLEERQIKLSPIGKKGSTFKVPKNHLNLSQIENFKARGIISTYEE